MTSRTPSVGDHAIASPDLVGSDRDAALASVLGAALEPLLAIRPVAGSDAGLRTVREAIEARLCALGFTVAHHVATGGPPIVVATRRGAGPHWIGLSGHYDIEQGGDGWTTDPFAPLVRAGRLYGRGTADNLGPLLLRLVALAGVAPWSTPSLVWVIQGEEEIGSPAAHAIYPMLRLPPVALWLEETGYFELDGRQRVLLRRPSSLTRSWIETVLELGAAAGRGIDVHDRYLNKAFGANRCPFLTHLADGATYLAIGPNDPWSRIHEADESLPLHNMALSADQFVALLRAAVAT
jgi:acetylornithine deacetylase/succinyl-diaminopimelate desuccinylase-like protein